MLYHTDRYIDLITKIFVPTYLDPCPFPRKSLSRQPVRHGDGCLRSYERNICSPPHAPGNLQASSDARIRRHGKARRTDVANILYRRA